MSRTITAILAVLIVLFAGPVAQARAIYAYEVVSVNDAADLANQDDEDLYDEATEAIDEGNWRDAINNFNEVIRANKSRVDAALYWKAYAQGKLGQKTEALETVAQLEKRFPRSRYVKDAKALDLEIRQSAGQQVRPEGMADDDLKIAALQSLLNSSPDRAVATIDKILKGNASPRVKDRALFVLAQMDNEKAAALLAGIAQGQSNPDLQVRAVKYLGIHGTERNRAFLANAYRNGNPDVKKAVLKALMISGDKGRLLEVARGEKDPELRADAVRQLGVMGAAKELSDLYKTETTREVKKAILRSMFVGGSVDNLGELAKNERDPELRAIAVKNLGLTGHDKTGALLLSIYQSDPSPRIRDAVIDALFIQSNGRVLVQLARQEKDPALKREIVRKLSLMNTPESLNYMEELLNN